MSSHQQHLPNNNYHIFIMNSTSSNNNIINPFEKIKITFFSIFTHFHKTQQTTTFITTTPLEIPKACISINNTTQHHSRHNFIISSTFNNKNFIFFFTNLSKKIIKTTYHQQQPWVLSTYTSISWSLSYP
jgi:hypothetical protein